MREECGSAMPAALKANWVRPEQSKPPGPAPAHTYGVPCWASAVSTATCAAWVGAVTAAEAAGAVTATEVNVRPAPRVRATRARRAKAGERRAEAVRAAVIETGFSCSLSRLPS